MENNVRNMEGYDKERLSEVLKAYKSLAKIFLPFEKMKINDDDIIEKFEKALDQINKDVIIKILDDNTVIARELINKAKVFRLQLFKRYEADFINSIKAKGEKIREYNNGWRIGKIEVQVKPELSKVRALYNTEILINWQLINNPNDLVKIFKEANIMLENNALEDDLLIESFTEAYKSASIHNNSYMIPIFDFYRELRVTLIKKFLEKKSPDSKIDKYVNFPKWAFLYNLDRYFSLIQNKSLKERLTLITGSQHEVSKGNGMVINGLEPNTDYKVICYVSLINNGDNI